MVAQPDFAFELVDDDPFSKARGLQAKMRSKYETLRKLGRGAWLFMELSHRFGAGDLIMIDYPTLIFPGITDPPEADVDRFSSFPTTREHGRGTSPSQFDT